MRIVLGQKADKAARQNQGGNRLLVKTGGAARQAQLLADLQIGRVVAQAGKRQRAQRIPIQAVVRAAKQGMAGAAVQAHMLIKQARVVQGAGGAVAGDDAQVKLAIEHAALYGIERGDMQIERHVRRPRVKARYRLRQAGLGVAGSFVKHRYLQLAAHALVNLIDAAAKRVGSGQQLGGLRVNFLALRRQGEAGPPTAAQAQAQAGFQVFDVAADGGATDIELQFGSSHATAVGHHPEHAQQAQVHVAELA